MRIASSVIRLDSQRTSAEREFMTRKVKAAGENDQKQSDKVASLGFNFDRELKMPDRSALAKAAGLENLSRPTANQVQMQKPVDTQTRVEEAMEKRVRMMKNVLEKLTGRKISISNASDASNPANAVASPETLELKEFFEQKVLVEETYHHYEMESTSFDAAGIIKTQDGQEISFNLSMSMSRESVFQTSTAYETTVSMLDPLVVNFNGNAADLSNMKFSFDLDADGTDEEISTLSGGSGFLALDTNSDGKINNGNELFGPQTGNGFMELAQYDFDGNGWIDESDPIFNDLKVWTKDEFGNDSLLGLLEADVGAISLSNVSTDFDLKDDTGQQNGRVRASGIYAKESGGVASIQHVDLAV